MPNGNTLCPPRTTSWNGCALVHDNKCLGDMTRVVPDWNGSRHATWAGNPASVQQQTCLGQRYTHLPQPAYELTDLKYSEKKSNGEPLLLEISLVMALICQSNFLYFDFKWDINQFYNMGRNSDAFLCRYIAKISHKPYLKPVPL